MRKHFAVVALMLCLAPLRPALAADPALPSLIIVEIQTGGSTSALQEFVEIYNPTASSVDVTGWKLQYRSSSSLPTASWTDSSTKTTIGCGEGCTVIMPPGGKLLFYRNIDDVSGQLLTGSGMASSPGGQIRLLQPASVAPNGIEVVQDMVGYGTAATYEGSAPAPSLQDGLSLKRKVLPSGAYQDTGNNAADFTTGCGDPTPGDLLVPLAGTADGCPLYELPEPPVVEPSTPDPLPEPTPDQPPPNQTDPPVDTPPANEPPAPNTDPPPSQEPSTDQPPAAPSDPIEPPAAETPAPQDAPTPSGDPTPPIDPAPAVLPLIINEVFPDPASPQVDASDEFVEIYNPNSSPVSTAGYVIKTGDTFQHVVNLPAVTIEAGGYMVIKSADSTLSLVNTGTGVRLFDPSGQQVSEAPNYLTAHAGEGWMFDGTTWQWTLTPTLATANILTLPTPEPQPDPEAPTTPTDPPAGPADETPTPGQGGNPVYLPASINELLPDPSSPAQDASDEFIELFNPGSEPVILKDYQLQTGADFRYKFTLPDITLAPGGYIALRSEETGLVLSNSGTAVRLLDPTGQLLDEIASYGNAVEGQTWAKAADGTWRWSTTPTPGAPNLLTSPPPKAASVKKASTKKVATSKAKVASASKAKSAATAPEAFYQEELDSTGPNYWLLGGVGSLVVGYALYEYREGLGRGFGRLTSLVRGKGSK